MVIEVKYADVARLSAGGMHEYRKGLRNVAAPRLATTRVFLTFHLQFPQTQHATPVRRQQTMLLFARWRWEFELGGPRGVCFARGIGDRVVPIGGHDCEVGVKLYGLSLPVKR